MISTHSHKDDFLPSIDWSKTRSIYKKLSDEFHVLTDAYNIVIDNRTKIMLDHLILGIDNIDQTIDDLPTKIDRDSITQSILEFLQNTEVHWKHPGANDLLKQNIDTLKHIVKELAIEKRFLTAATNIFHKTEEKRHVLESQKLIQLVLEEGKSTGELPLSVMLIEADSSFGIFFTKLCTLMGIADLLIDARSDYKSAQIALKPKLTLYVHLSLLLIKEGLSMVWHFPKKWNFLKYCLSFGMALLVSKD